MVKKRSVQDGVQAAKAVVLVGEEVLRCVSELDKEEKKKDKLADAIYWNRD